MIGRIALGRALRATGSTSRFVARSMGTIASSSSATDAMKSSCYREIDFTVPEDEPAIVACQKMAAFDIGCLVTTDSQGNLSGVVSERDIVMKIGSLQRKAKDVKISEISTKAAKLVTATPEDSVTDCMNKMIESDVRHLPVINESGSVSGLLSIKDCVKATLEEKEEAIKVLQDFAMGKGGTFVVD